MSLLMVIAALSSLAPPAQVAADVAPTSDAKPALDWLALVDAERWAQSWQDAGALFRSQVAETTWVTMAKGVRQPLGAVTNRAVLSIERSTTLPGLPVGEYRVVRFTTSFANKPGAIETLALVREANGWKVIGYFIR